MDSSLSAQSEDASLDVAPPPSPLPLPLPLPLPPSLPAAAALAAPADDDDSERSGPGAARMLSSVLRLALLEGGVLGVIALLQAVTVRAGAGSGAGAGAGAGVGASAGVGLGLLGTGDPQLVARLFLDNALVLYLPVRLALACVLQGLSHLSATAPQRARRLEGSLAAGAVAITAFVVLAGRSLVFAPPSSAAAFAPGSPLFAPASLSSASSSSASFGEAIGHSANKVAAVAALTGEGVAAHGVSVSGGALPPQTDLGLTLALTLCLIALLFVGWLTSCAPCRALLRRRRVD